MSLLSFYDFYLRSNPLATKMLTNFAICCTGDIICQTITRRQLQIPAAGDEKSAPKTTEWDMVRVARFGAVGACVQTTLLHYYLTRAVPYLTISKETIRGDLARHHATTLLRVGVHLCSLLPVRIGLIFFALSTLQHLSVRKGIEGLQANYWDGLAAAYVYWPLVLLGMYAFVPRRYGNLFYDCFNLMWAVALSYFASRDAPAQTVLQTNDLLNRGKSIQETSQLAHSLISQSNEYLW